MSATFHARADWFGMSYAAPVRRMATVVVVWLLCAASAQAQRNMPVPLDPADSTGFTSIFDGRSLEGWDGDPAFWRVEGGAIVGESTAERPLPRNTFLVWRGGEPANFELKLEYRMNSTNSGIQYRSTEAPDVGAWVLKGYQADIDFQNTYTGQLYEERGRGFLALRGQSTWMTVDGPPRIIGSLGDGDALKAHIRPGDWNSFHVIARGHMLVHILNGHVMSVAVDDDEKARAASGLLGFQMHTGPPMKVEFRNIRLRTLPD
jgi:hypothetical protein